MWLRGERRLTPFYRAVALGFAGLGVLLLVAGVLVLIASLF
jgi:hypothetical protein